MIILPKKLVDSILVTDIQKHFLLNYYCITILDKFSQAHMGYIFSSCTIPTLNQNQLHNNIQTADNIN